MLTDLAGVCTTDLEIAPVARINTSAGSLRWKPMACIALTWASANCKCGQRPGPRRDGGHPRVPYQIRASCSFALST